MLTPIDWLTLPGRNGRVGMMACPGGGRHRETDDNAIRQDLDHLHASGGRVLVTLLPDDEMQILRVGRLADIALECGVHWLQLPVEDMHAPGEGFEIRWSEAGPMLHAALAAGQHVVLHCYAGLGRTGTVAARLLVEMGVVPQDAIEQVRAARRGAIQTVEQERYVMRLPAAGAAPHSPRPG